MFRGNGICSGEMIFLFEAGGTFFQLALPVVMAGHIALVKSANFRLHLCQGTEALGPTLLDFTQAKLIQVLSERLPSQATESMPAKQSPAHLRNIFYGSWFIRSAEPILLVVL